MLPISLFALALAIVALVTATWGLDQRRAHRIAEKRRANAFRLADVAGERERYHRALCGEAFRQLREAHAPAPHLYLIPAHQRDMHDDAAV